VRQVTAADLPDFDLTDDELRRTGSIKWTLQPPDVLPAWVAEMDVRPAPVVRDALVDAVARGALGYPSKPKVTGLPQATAAFLERRFGLQVDPVRVLPTADVMAGIRLVIEELCEDAPVVVPVPAYTPFLELVPLTRRKLVTVPCAEDDGRPVLDVDGIGRALAAGGRTVLFSNPYNPVGRTFTRPELVALRDVADRYGARVISDEVHAPLVLPGARHVPWETVAGDTAITVLATSKAFNTPGLKCAQLVLGSVADLTTLAALPPVANHGTSPLGIVATVAAYTAGDAWLDGLVAHLDGRRRQFTELLAEHLPGLPWAPMEGTYLAWLDARPTGLADPAVDALRRGRVMVNAGGTFGPGYDGFVRVNLGTSAERLSRIVRRLADAFTPRSP
jgi:cystathionine beta-lyase